MSSEVETSLREEPRSAYARARAEKVSQIEAVPGLSTRNDDQASTTAAQNLGAAAARSITG